MCNLYRMTKATAEVANLFNAKLGSIGNFATQVYPGYPGLVVAKPEAGNRSAASCARWSGASRWCSRARTGSR